MNETMKNAANDESVSGAKPMNMRLLSNYIASAGYMQALIDAVEMVKDIPGFSGLEARKDGTIIISTNNDWYFDKLPLEPCCDDTYVTETLEHGVMFRIYRPDWGRNDNGESL